MPADERFSSNGFVSAVGEEFDQRFLVGTVEKYFAIFHAAFVAPFAYAVEECVDLLEILFANDGWFGDQVVGSFQVDESYGSVEGEGEFRGVQQMEEANVVPLETKVLDGLHQFGEFAEKV